MELKLAELVNMREALEKLVQMDLPIKQSFLLSKFAKKATVELQEFEEQRVKLVNKYGETDETTGTTSVAPANLEAFRKDLDELTDVELFFDIPPIRVEALENVKISVSDLMALEPILVMDNNPMPMTTIEPPSDQ